MSSAVGWSCATLKDGYDAVMSEEEKALAEQEQLIMEEIKDSGFSPCSKPISQYHKK